MKAFLAGITLCFFLAVPLRAQNYSRMEAYGGFLLLHDDFLNNEGNKNNYLGATGAFELNAKSWFGFVADFGYGYGLGDELVRNEQSSYYINRSHTSLLIGPRFGYRGERVRFFGHYFSYLLKAAHCVISGLRAGAPFIYSLF